MDDDLKAVVGRLDATVNNPTAWWSWSESGSSPCVDVQVSDLRTLLSAFRQRDEALRDMLAMYGSKYDGEMRLKEPAEIEVIETARAILTESETNAR